MDLLERKKYIEELKREYFAAIENQTPTEIKGQPIFDLSNKNEFTLKLTKELVEKWKLDEWLNNYRHEAQHSTGGIRGPQNVLYYWDTRFPINQLGVALATIAKVLVLQENNPGKKLHKIASGEVRYNTDQYIELISRLEAALEVTVHQPKGIHLTTIWMTSFLIFMNDYDGGEYVSSSHAISSKTATKDLEDQGSQFLPEMSMAFVDKIGEILTQAKKPEGYIIKIAAQADSRIVKDFDGFKLYADYLRRSVATESALEFIDKAARSGYRLMFDTVGGCMYENMKPLFKELALPDIFDWHNMAEDPFFHGVGKARRLNKLSGREEFFDLSCDVSLPEVARTMNYDFYCKDKPLGYTLLITDPDGDRLIVGQIEPKSAIPFFEEIGVDYILLDNEKVLSIYHPAFTFLLLMDFHMQQLKRAGLWKNHSRFIVSTTPSPRSWDEWAKNNDIRVVSTPVGIKEIATVMKKTEKQIKQNQKVDVVVEDIWGNKVALGREPRVVFGGEESGGMIIGPEDMVKSLGGREALAMREKSAGEAIVIATALGAYLHSEHKFISEHLRQIFEENNINYRCYFRADITYYNESEPDPIKMKQAKAEGEIKRDKIDTFYLGLALSRRENNITIEQTRDILQQAMPELSFVDLEDVLFVGDASYLAFKNMFVEIRRSGTDAKLRGYVNGLDSMKCKHYLDVLVHYSGNLPELYKQLIPDSYRANLYTVQDKIYKTYLYNGL